MKILSRLFSNNVRAITPNDVEPASVPDSRKEARLDAGRTRLEHYMTSAERTVAATAELFAEAAVRELRR